MFASRPANKGTLGYGKALFCLFEGETASDRLSELLDNGIKQNAFAIQELNSLIETAKKIKANPKLILILTQQLQQLQQSLAPNPTPVVAAESPKFER